jgi:predicted GIY-YIG superfamily endonuclease
MVLLSTGTTGCDAFSDSPQAEPEPSCIRDKTSYSLGPDTYAEVGKLGDAKGNGRPFVTVFDEQHASRIGQVEIAMMLNRLYHTSNLRNLALEGSIVEKPRPDLGWFTSKPDARHRVDVALQLLRQGEVSAAEFAAMALPGFQLHPIEHENEHKVDLPDAAARSYTSYMVAIAVMSMTDSQATQAEALLKQDKKEEAIKFIIDSNPWTKERYELINRKTPVVTTEQMQKVGTELEDKAQQVGADISEYRDGLQTARKFFDTSTQRSSTMAAATADIATARVGDCAPIAMNIGAAHSNQIAGLLSQKNVSYAVVSPSSLATGTAIGNGSLSMQAYDRKVKGQSADPAGGIGAFLDGRRKPQLASQNEWFKAKAEIGYATVVIARAAAAAGGSGQQPPFDLDQKQLGLAGSGPGAPSISIDLSTMKMVQVQDNGKTRNEVIFQVTLLKQKTGLWIRAGAVATQPGAPDSTQTLQQSLEQALKKMREEISKEPPADDPAPSAQSKVVDIVSGIKAAVASSAESAAAVNLILVD